MLVIFIVQLQTRLKIARDLYCSDERSWVIAFSGGKDSTAILQLIWMALAPLSTEARSKPVDVCYVDTGMDHPLYKEQVAETIKQISTASQDAGMPFRFHVIEPEIRHRFFVAVLGRGYAPPTHWFRWCTKGMRIRPMSSFIRNALSVSGKVVIVLGLRKSESDSRKRIIEEYSKGVPFLSNYGSFKDAVAFTPIEDFSKEDVWQFLMQARVPWGGRNNELIQLYSLASGGECASYSNVGGMGPSCGGSRFGCWTCTVVRRDKSGAALADQDDRFEALIDFRNWLLEIRYDTRRRWIKRRNGAAGPGPLRLSTRREALRRVLDAEIQCGYKLITAAEITAIQEHWQTDGDRNYTALHMYRDHLTTSLKAFGN